VTGRTPDAVGFRAGAPARETEAPTPRTFSTASTARAPMRYDALVVTTIPPYRVTARTTSATSENKIHDDTVARRYGFRGALVPGTTVYAYMIPAIVGGLGMEWLSRGQASLRLREPVYDAEEVRVGAVVVDDRTLDVTAANSRDETCATVRVSMAGATVPAVDIIAYPRADLPAERPPAGREVFERLTTLGSAEVDYDEATAADYVGSVGDPGAVYQGSSGCVHPAFYLQLANRALSQNVRLGAWIHVGSEVRHLAPARVGARLDARGRVARLFEKKGHEFAELDLLLVADGERPIAHVRHTAIYQVAHRASSTLDQPETGASIAGGRARHRSS
jgi:acyl dehydratase